MSDLQTLTRTAAYSPKTPVAQTGKALPAATPDTGGVFGALLDVVNPLQHIPGVSTAYQQASGDTMSAGASILGGGLFGGFIGAGVALLGEAFKAVVGEDPASAALHGAQALITPAEHPLGTPLVGDNGAAARELAAAGLPADDSAPRIVAAPDPAVATASNLEPYKNRALDLDKPEMGRQTDASLQDVALKMA